MDYNSGSSMNTTSFLTVATCTLNQWSMDFDGNLMRIVQSCDMARKSGAVYRLGPELEICGYGCEDHFLEHDTFIHCWESLVGLLTTYKSSCEGMVIDTGMPVLVHGVRYNCRILCWDGQILLIRPKTALADNGNYRESRYFTAYEQQQQQATGLIDFLLPKFVQDAIGQRTVPFGLGHIQTNDGVKLGCESCEELWTPQATHIGLALRGVEIITNGSGSHHELRKLNTRLELILNATSKCGGIYLYSNQRGCDGGRLYYDGGAIIACNGKLLAQAPQFDVQDVHVITATVDLEEVRSYRASLPSFGIQAVREQQQQKQQQSIQVDCPQLHFLMTTTTGTNSSRHGMMIETTVPRELIYSTPEEECCLGPACWLWDYLRRSGATGFLLPLSGGADSSSVALIVFAMCQLVVQAAPHDSQVAKDVRRICQKEEYNEKNGEEETWLPSTPQEFANYILHTIFMGTEHSSQNTTLRSKRLGEVIGSYHLNVPIDTMVKAVIQTFALATGGPVPQFESQGGTMTQDLALQNIQARLRMVTAYLFAQLLPWSRKRKGFLLVLGSANVDEGLRGYMTKYDCSSADLNPIGAISKGDLKRMLLWGADHYGKRRTTPSTDSESSKGDDTLRVVLEEIAGAPPTAELRPLADAVTGGGTGDTNAEHSQLDEEEMGMTYEELGWFGRLRKFNRCGPVSMFRTLCIQWRDTCTPRQVAIKVQRFFYYYAVNRHKMCTLTPSYHAEGYSPDDNRFDLRQFLYNTKWPRQFTIMNQLVNDFEEEGGGEGGVDDGKNKETHNQ